MDIRPLRPADRDAWQQLYQGYQAFYDHPDRPQSFFDTAFARLLSGDQADYQGLVAERDGQLLGLTHYVRHPHLWRPEGVIYLQDLFTTPQSRGQGVGRRLIQAVYDSADQAGISYVYWNTAETNYAGRMLYDSVGVNSGFIKYTRP